MPIGPSLRAFAVTLIAAAAAQAAVFTVNDTDDLPDVLVGDGICAASTTACTLRAAAQEAGALAGDDEIRLPAGTYAVASTIVLFQRTAVVGAGAAATILDGVGASSRVLSASDHLTLAGVTVRNGGGVLAPSGLVTDCIFTGNAGALIGGGLQLGSGTVLRSTFSGNTANLGGGGLVVSAGAVRDSTFTGNVSLGLPIAIGGDAIATGGGGTLVIANSTVQGDITNFSFCNPPPTPTCNPGSTVELRNVTGQTAHLTNLAGAPAGSITVRNSIMTACLAGGFGIASGGHNVFVTAAVCPTNPLLGDMVVPALSLSPLDDNGGPTQTRLPPPGSAPVDAGGTDCEPTDQRGVPRPIGAGCDIGAVELGCGNGTLDPGEACDDGNHVDGDGCDHTCTPTGCGNRVVGAGETCDDGNLVSGDCCDGSCQLEAAGSACGDDGNPCTDEVCSPIGSCLRLFAAGSCDDGDQCTMGDFCSAGSCRPGSPVPCGDPCLACYPDAGCGPHRLSCVGDEPGKSALTLRRTAGEAGDRLKLRWRTSAPVTVSDFLDPLLGTSTQLVCVYDGAGGVVLHAYPNAGCDGSGCWEALPDGFTYRDRSASADGVLRIDLRAGPPDGKRAAITVRGKGPNLVFGGPGPLALPVRAVLEASTLLPPFPYTTVQACFDATFDAGVRANTAERFQAKSD